MTDRSELVFVHGGHKGAEAEFGRCAEKWGVREVTYSFPGHAMERSQNVRDLTEAELEKGDVSMEIVSRRMGRTYHRADRIRRVLQSLFHLVVDADQVLAVGWIQSDGTVKGGTGWGVELAKFFHRPVWVFDQDREAWFRWTGRGWEPDQPKLGAKTTAGTGTRNLTEEGRAAIAELFRRSLGEPE